MSAVRAGDARAPGARRAVVVALVVLGTAAATWVAWPRPAAHLRVERGGTAYLVDALGRTTALPETVHVAARGRGTTVRVENRDTTWQQLGLFGAAAGTTRDFTVPERGRYAGYCSAHRSRGRLVYVVE
ncbi:MAG: hypothetical protein MUF21_07815 [Gemmatimonadaceae bacterium]|nr:hypothetical protein [Gemmatimonadaceae bacterium]